MDLRHQGRDGLAELCFQAAGGDPWLALWLGVTYFEVYRRREELRARMVGAAV